MNRPTWQFYGWWGIVLPAFVVAGITSALVGVALAAILPVRLPQRAAH